jgi:type II secretion system protein H
MKILTSVVGNKGFTLIELLIVLLIIGIVTSIATLSVNTARPSEVQTLYKQLQKQLHQSQKTAQLKNINLRLIIKDNQSKIERRNPSTQQWLETSQINTIKWQDIEVNPSELLLYIFPNGYTTPFSLTISHDNESYKLIAK